jgi:hypothetical protein
MIYRYFVFETELYLWSPETYEFNAPRNAVWKSDRKLTRQLICKMLKMIRYLQITCIDAAYLIDIRQSCPCA